MDFRLKVGAFLAGALIMSAGAAHAMNITIWDKQGSGTGWYGVQEDQEVEPGCVTGQFWDLEGFYLNGNTLSMVGGYDFKNGKDGFDSGDIFIGRTGNVVYGTDNFNATGSNGIVSVTNQWRYDYAIDLNFSTNTYTLYGITNSSLLTAYYRNNDESNPWAYQSGGTQLGTGAFSYATLTDAAAIAAGFGDFNGNDTHNVVSLELDFLPAGSFIAHFTMECGNDNLMGSVNVPESGTLLLFSGFLLISLPVIRRFPLS